MIRIIKKNVNLIYDIITFIIGIMLNSFFSKKINVYLFFIDKHQNNISVYNNQIINKKLTVFQIFLIGIKSITFMIDKILK